jgi:hypothetical protein
MQYNIAKSIKNCHKNKRIRRVEKMLSGRVAKSTAFQCSKVLKVTGRVI